MFALRDGTEMWSDASSLNGRKAGAHYEGKVAQAFCMTGLKKGRPITAIAVAGEREGWQNMREEARRLSESIVSTGTLERIACQHGKTTQDDGDGNATAEADLEGCVTEKISLRRMLGASAELLTGPDEIKGTGVMEVSVMSALLLIKMAQLERYLQIRALANMDAVD